MKLTSTTARALLLALVVIVLPYVTFAIELAPGDILVSDTNVDALFHVDPETGDRTIVSSNAVGAGAKLGYPMGMAVPGDGSVLVVDLSARAILRVDPTTGNRASLTGRGKGEGAGLRGPRAIVLTRDGNLIVSDTSTDTLVRVDPSTGDRSVVASREIGTGPGLKFALGLALLEDGQLVAADSELNAIVRIDLATGNRTILSSNQIGTGPQYIDPSDIVIASDGSALVVNNTPIAGRRGREPGLVRVDLDSGDRTLLSGVDAGTGRELRTAASLVLEADGSILVIDPARDILFRIDPVTGDRVVISSAEVGSGPTFRSPRRITIVPSPPADSIGGRLGWISWLGVAGAAIIVLSIVWISHNRKG
jgi:sugar lactone lactonase YvrE